MNEQNNGSERSGAHEEEYELLDSVPYEEYVDGVDAEGLTAVDRMNIALGGVPKERVPSKEDVVENENLWRKFKDNEVEPEPLPKSGTPGVLPTQSGYGKPGYPGGPEFVPDGLIEPVRSHLLIAVGIFTVLGVWVFPLIGVLGLVTLVLGYRNRLVVLQGNEEAAALNLPELYSMRNTNIALTLSVLALVFAVVRFLL